MTKDDDVAKAWAIIEDAKHGPVHPDVKAALAAALAGNPRRNGNPLHEAIAHLRRNPSWEYAQWIVSTFDLLR